MKCVRCGAEEDSTKHQMMCVLPQVEKALVQGFDNRAYVCPDCGREPGPGEIHGADYCVDD